MWVGVVVMALFWGEAWATESESVLPPIEGGETLSAVEKVKVRKFQLNGNKVFTDEELGVILSPYENREITAEELQEAKNVVTRFYIDRGYVNSGAVIPDQPLRDGIIRMRITEGRLSRTEISGNTWLREGYISGRLRLTTDPDKGPLNIIALQERLKLIRQDPRVENIDASLAPGLTPGEAILNVGVEESRPYHIWVGFNNHNSPSIGAYRGEMGLRHMNLTGWGDALSAEYALTEGLDEFAVNYTIPITRWDTTLAFDVERSESDVISSPFDKLKIQSKTMTYGVSLRHPFYKTLSKEFSMGLRLEKRESETYLLSQSYSFEGPGESDIAVLRFSQEWVDRSMSHVLALRSTFGFGLDMMGATGDYFRKSDGVTLKGEFFTWMGQFQWLKRISPLNSQIILKTDLRVSADPLLPLEKFSIGGASTVRGYRENQITTDSGVISSLEWQIPIVQLKIPGVSKGETDGFLHLAPFFDFGYGWNTDLPDPDPDSICSLGLGLRWVISKSAFAEIYWGHALEDVVQSGEDDLQDDGVHFQLNIEY